MTRNIKLFKMINGEMVLTEVDDVTDEGMYVLNWPAVIIPVPPERANGMENQVGFGKYLPFSNYDEYILLSIKAVALESTPNTSMLNAYKQWCTQVRAQEAGIVSPGSMRSKGEIVKPGEFEKLNM